MERFHARKWCQLYTHNTLFCRAILELQLLQEGKLGHAGAIIDTRTIKAPLTMMRNSVSEFPQVYLQRLGKTSCSEGLRA